MISKFNVSKLYFLLIVFTFFGCKEQLFDSPLSELDSSATPVPAPVTAPVTPPTIKWYLDTAAVPLPVSDGMPINPSYKNGNKTATIVVLGSSTAMGKGASAKKYSWVELMKAQLKKDNKTVNVVNLGEGGFTTYHIMPNGNKVKNRPNPDTKRNITKALSHKPFLVIINLPTNDVDKGYTDNEVLNNFARVRYMLDSAKVNYIATGTQPRNFTEKKQRTRLRTLNDKMVNLDPVHVVNVLRKLSNEDFSIKKHFAFTDGIHTNDKGHSIINSYIFNSTEFRHILGYTAINP